MTDDLEQKPRETDEESAPGQQQETAERIALPDTWQSEINLSMNAAQYHLEARLQRIDNFTLKAKSVVRRGQFITCTLEEFAGGIDEIASVLIPGTRVTLVGRKCTKKPYKHNVRKTGERLLLDHAAKFTEETVPGEYERTTLGAEFKSMRENENGDTVVSFLITENGPLNTELDFDQDDLFEIHYKDNKRRPKKRMELLKKCREGDLTKPAQVFLSGAFEIPDKNTLEAQEGLDEAQNKAFGMAMAYERCPVLFIHGGPGTGKTRTICSIVEKHVKRGRKVLVLSHSNKGTDVPAVMMTERIKKGELPEMPIFRAGNNPQVVDQRLHQRRIMRKIKFPAKELRHVDRAIEREIMEWYVEKEAKLKGISKEKWLEQHECVSATEFFKKSPLVLETANPAYLQHQGVKSMKELEELKKEAILRKHMDQIANRGKRYMEAIEDGGSTFSTLGTLLTDQILGEAKYDVVIVDEATRLRDPDMLLALQKAETQIIFVGDPLQLGNIPLAPQEIIETTNRATEKGNWNIANYAQTRSAEGMIDETRTAIAALFGDREPARASSHWIREVDRAIGLFALGSFSRAILHSKDPERELPYVFLNMDRRSRENIVKVLSNLIYDGKLLPGRESPEGEHKGIVEWVDTGKIRAREKAAGTSKRNPKEAEIIVEMVLARVLHKDKTQRVSPKDIAIIATYAEQAAAIRRIIKKKLWNNKVLAERLCSNIASVDAFQGDERPVVYVSMTRSNTEGEVGFLEEERRIGVAVGRARDELYIIGDIETLTSTNKNSESKDFFGRLGSEVRTHGKIRQEKYRPYNRGRGKRRGHGKKTPAVKTVEAVV